MVTMNLKRLVLPTPIGFRRRYNLPAPASSHPCPTRFIPKHDPKVTCDVSCWFFPRDIPKDFGDQRSAGLGSGK